MAKLVGLIGSGRGKLGNTVLYKGEKGETYARVYQPKVQNPRTQGQVNQRAKINLAGQISALASKALLAPIGISGRRNRAEFLKSLINAIEIQTVSGVTTAEIQPNEIKFSRGQVPLQASIGKITIESDIITVPLTINDASKVEKYGERVIALVYNNADSNASKKIVYADAVIRQNTEQNVFIKLGFDLTTDNVVAIYRVPFEFNDANTVTKYEALNGTEDDIVAQVLAAESQAISWGATEFVKAENFTQA